MKNYKPKKITKTEEVLVSVNCDRCQKKLVIDVLGKWSCLMGGGEMIFNMGYGSKFDDVNCLEFDICDDCAEDILKGFQKKVVNK